MLSGVTLHVGPTWSGFRQFYAGACEGVEKGSGWQLKPARVQWSRARASAPRRPSPLRWSQMLPREARGSVLVYLSEV